MEVLFQEEKTHTIMLSQWRIPLLLKAEGVVGFYGQKSPLDKGTSASTRRSIAACMVRAAGVCGMISTFFCTLTTHQGA